MSRHGAGRLATGLYMDVDLGKGAVSTSLRAGESDPWPLGAWPRVLQWSWRVIGALVGVSWCRLADRWCAGRAGARYQLGSLGDAEA